MAETSKISVILPVHGKAPYIRDAIQSILLQTYKDFELIVIKDRAEESLNSELEKISNDDSRIKLVSSNGVGISAAINTGIENAVGKYIARMDSDDISSPDRFEMQVNYLNTHHKIAILGSQVIYIDEKGKNIGRSSLPRNNNQISRELNFYNCVAHPTVMIRKSIFQEIGLYDRHYDGAEDYQLWLRVIQKFKIANLSKPLLKYRISNYQVTNSSSRIHGKIEKTILWEKALNDCRQEFHKKKKELSRRSIDSVFDELSNSLALNDIYLAKGSRRSRLKTYFGALIHLDFKIKIGFLATVSIFLLRKIAAHFARVPR